MTDALARLTVALSDRYTIERELGRGGMATVYLAEDLKHHRKVAVKVLRPELAAALGADRFHQEIEIAAQLTHPHILPLHDSGDADGFLYFVMPYIEGQSLRDKLAHEGELPIAEAVRILRDVVEALRHAHKHSVVHRDIKPDNVMLSEDHALVTDFGVAKAVSDATGAIGLTTEGVALGTPAYMSPEQAAADPHIDHRADIYAVGVIAYELLTGRTPFVGTTQQELLAAHVTQTPDPVTKYRESVPPALAQLVMRCLKKKPADRWQTAEELLPQLEALATPSGGVTPTGTMPTGGATTAARRKIVSVAGVSVAVMAVAVGAWAILRSEPSTLVPNRVIVAPFENRTGDAGLDDLSVMVMDWLGQGLIQTTVAEVVPTGTVLHVANVLSAASGQTVVDPRELGNATNATVVISGAYYLAGDSIRFQWQISHVSEERVVSAPEDVLASAADPVAGIDALRSRAMTVIVTHLDPARPIEIIGNPPLIGAYREYLAGVEYLFLGQMESAAAHFSRAYALDTTFLRALRDEYNTYRNTYTPESWSRADSVWSLLEVRSDRMPSGILDWFRAAMDWDQEERYRVTLRDAGNAPSSNTVSQLAYEALKLNRPTQALEWLDQWVPDGSDYAGRHAMFRASALHWLGEHERELEYVQGHQTEFTFGSTALLFEVTALAALGHVEVMLPLLDEAESRVDPVAGAAPLTAALELEAHGYLDEASRLYAGIIEGSRAFWEENPLPAVAGLLAYALWRSGDPAAAREIVDSARVGFAVSDVFNVVPDVVHLGTVGILAAAVGDTAEAERVSSELATRTDRWARPTARWFRGQIAAELGQLEKALRLLREAYRELGFSGRIPHPHVAVPRALREYGPFQEFMRPKG